MKVKVLDNSINTGWNVGDIVEIGPNDVKKYGKAVQALEVEPKKVVKKDVSKTKSKNK